MNSTLRRRPAEKPYIHDDWYDTSIFIRIHPPQDDTIEVTFTFGSLSSYLNVVFFSFPPFFFSIFFLDIGIRAAPRTYEFFFWSCLVWSGLVASRKVGGCA